MTREEARYYLQSSGFSEEQMDTIEQAFTCEDAISRQAVCDYIAEFVNNEYSSQAECEMVDAMIEGIQHLPPVTPQPKTGHWIRQDNTKEPLYGWYFCSECNSVIGDKTKFCSNCGAKMEGSNADSD